MKPLLTLFIACLLAHPLIAESGDGWLSFPGAAGPGKGKHVVLLAGDEEYRSEEAMPMLAKILSTHHGFDTTVLFSHDPDGTINPNNTASLGKPDALDTADVIVMSLRFRNWPDEAMRHFDAAMQRGVPVIGLRTSTHAFKLAGSSTFKQYNDFGKNTLGEKWVSHWGKHKSEATRGVIEAPNFNHPLLRGVVDIFGDSDVYEANPPADATILLRGQVLSGMTPNSAPATREKSPGRPINDPMMPIAWTREVKTTAGKSQKVLCSTMGAATDLASEGLRRLVVNGVFWAAGLEVPASAEVNTVGDFVPSNYSTNGFKKGLRAADQ